MPLPIAWAKATWASFNEKFKALTGEPPQNVNQAFEQTQKIESERNPNRIEAAQKIINWWKAQRSSGRSVPINLNGNHTQAFRTYLNGLPMKKRLSFFRDQLLLRDIESGNLNSTRFKDQNVVLSILNLFASGKISWQQKATLSSVVEAQGSFGAFIAYSIIDAKGKLTTESSQFLLPFLHKGFTKQPNNALTDQEKAKFLALVKTLPLSEQCFFVFPHQKTNGTNSFPSLHNEIRETAALYLPGTRFLNVTYNTRNGIPSYFSDKPFSYEGVLKLSFGAENALGLSTYGVENWFALIPILGQPSIHTVDFFGQREARPMISADSIYLKILTQSPVTHGSPSALSDVEAHDLYHRYVASCIGKNVHQGVERIIEVARQTFGFQFSKDLWLLRDFDFSCFFTATRKGELNKLIMGQNEYATKCFLYTIMSKYLPSQLENCTDGVQKAYGKSLFMFRPYQEGVAHSLFPHQIAICFLIDLVRHPDIWRQYHIVVHESYFDHPYTALLKMTKYLHENQFFTEDRKANVLKMEAFIQSQPSLVKDPLTPIDRIIGTFYSSWEAPADRQALQKLAISTHALFEQIEAELPDYHAHRDNRTVFLGFRKNAQIKSIRKNTIDNINVVDNQQSKKAKKQ